VLVQGLEQHDVERSELHGLDHVLHGLRVSGQALQCCELHGQELNELCGEGVRWELQGRGYDSLHGVALYEEEPLLHGEQQDEGVLCELQGEAQLVQDGEQ